MVCLANRPLSAVAVFPCRFLLISPCAVLQERSWFSLVFVPVDKAAEAKSGGWDFIEENVQALLRGTLPDDQWHNADAGKHAALPILAANCLVPGDLKITGPTVDFDRLTTYITRVLRGQERGHQNPGFWQRRGAEGAGRI